MILKDAGFSNFEQIIITCVDSEYPVRSLGNEFEHLDVSYTAAHEQRAQTATARLDLRIGGDGRFAPVLPEEIPGLLDAGVVQLLQAHRSLVIGIPGDVYAFYPEGNGFGLGTPYAACSDEARHLLRALAAYGHASEIVAMTHPDCALIAHNEGKYQTCAGESTDPFPASPYGVWEAELKQNAAESLRIYVQNILNLRFRAVLPPYVIRRPAILDAIRTR